MAAGLLSGCQRQAAKPSARCCPHGRQRSHHCRTLQPPSCRGHHCRACTPRSCACCAAPVACRRCVQQVSLGGANCLHRGGVNVVVRACGAAVDAGGCATVQPTTPSVRAPAQLIRKETNQNSTHGERTTCAEEERRACRRRRPPRHWPRGGPQTRRSPHRPTAPCPIAKPRRCTRAALLPLMPAGMAAWVRQRAAAVRHGCASAG